MLNPGHSWQTMPPATLANKNKQDQTMITHSTNATSRASSIKYTVEHITYGTLKSGLLLFTDLCHLPHLQTRNTDLRYRPDFSQTVSSQSLAFMKDQH